MMPPAMVRRKESHLFGSKLQDPGMSSDLSKGVSLLVWTG